MAEEIIKMRIKYRGLIDFQEIVRASKKFFVDRRMEFLEKKYKDKGDEFEGEWVAKNKANAYDMAVYTVEFKAIDMRPVVKEGKTLFTGKLQVIITAEIEEYFGEASPAGKKLIFEEPKGESWLHKIYKKVTQRDRYEQLAEEVFVTASNYQALVKGICNIDST